VVLEALHVKGGFTMAQLFFADLVNLFRFQLEGGGAGAKALVLTLQIGNWQALQLDLLGLLIVLGISVVAAVLVSLLTGGLRSSLVGSFFWALLGVWLFVIVVPIVWSGDYIIDGLPLITALVGAFVVLLVRQLFHGGFRRRAAAA
jgi:hypothetical protein